MRVKNTSRETIAFIEYLFMSWILDKTFFQKFIEFTYYEVTSKSGTKKYNHIYPDFQDDN